MVSYAIVQTNAHHVPIIKRHDHIAKLIEYESPHVAILKIHIKALTIQEGLKLMTENFTRNN